MNVTSAVLMADPKVYTSNNGGLSAEQLAEITTNKIIYADEGSVAPVIYQQAMAYKNKINRIVQETIKQAKRSSYVDFIAEAEKVGLTEMADALRKRLIDGNY